MRQAGRSLPEYLRVREGISMLDSCTRPELITEITLQPLRRYDVDAAILFSDIVVPLRAVGIDVDIKAGIGPVIDSSGADCGGPRAAARTGPARTCPTSRKRSGRSWRSWMNAR